MIGLKSFARKCLPRLISQARLLWFTFISGIALALHEHFQAYDERQAGLLDHMESLALSTRFATFLIIALLLISDASMSMSYVLGAFVLVVISRVSTEVTFDRGHLSPLGLYRCPGICCF